MSYQSQPVTMWFDRRIVYRKSPIHGTGTFAIEDIRAGETLVYVTGGLVYTPEDFQSGKVLFDGTMYNEEKLTDTLRIATPVSYHYFINHSCEPNIIDQSRHPSWTHYIALRDIRANEELTADYYIEATLAMCACGSPRCRWTRHKES
jgi:uncharacterized protein